jgi:hypothetical protein
MLTPGTSILAQSRVGVYASDPSVLKDKHTRAEQTGHAGRAHRLKRAPRMMVALKVLAR